MASPRQRRPHPVRRLVVVLAATPAILAGCSLGPQQHPVPLVGSRERPSNAASASPSALSRSLAVYLVHENRLVRIQRTAPIRRVEVDTALGGLFRPLSQRQRNEGLRTALPAGHDDPTVRLRHHVATLRLPPGTARLAVSEQILAIGQLVYTVSEHVATRKVRFTDGVHAVAVPDGSGRLVSRPVTRSDYTQIAPR